jgi:hypothetical protein
MSHNLLRITYHLIQKTLVWEVMALRCTDLASVYRVDIHKSARTERMGASYMGCKSTELVAWSPAGAIAASVEMRLAYFKGLQ